MKLSNRVKMQNFLLSDLGDIMLSPEMSGALTCCVNVSTIYPFSALGITTQNKYLFRDCLVLLICFQ